MKDNSVALRTATLVATAAMGWAITAKLEMPWPAIAGLVGFVLGFIYDDLAFKNKSKP